MGFYVRKSLKAGPFRFNVSKSGLGVSAGVPGFRVGTGPRGNYVRAGSHGVYYRASLGGKQRKALPGTTLSPAKPFLPPASSEVALEDVTGASAVDLVPTGGNDLVAQLNDASSRVRLAPWVLLATIVAAVALPTVAGVAVLVFGVAGTVWLWRRDRAGRSVVTFYQVEDGHAEWFAGMVEAFEALSGGAALGRVNASGRVRTTYEYKTNSGASNIVSRATAKAELKGPKVLVTNIAVPSISCGRHALHFLPDRLIVRDGKRFSDVPLCPRRKRWPGRRRGRVGAALVLASAALCCSVPVAAASSSDAQATHAYLIAQYKLGTALLHGVAAARGAESAAAAQIARECPGVVSGIPQEPFPKPFPAPPPRVRGENARRSQQKQTIEDELGAVVARAGDISYRPAEEAYVAEVRQLSWSNPAIASALQAATTARLEAISAPAPPFCADARAWAQSGYRALSAASREFEASQAARRRSDQGEERSLGTLLKPYENASDRALIRKTNTLENKFLASAFAAVRTFFRLERVVGFPKVGTEEPHKPIALGHGHTAAGTRFQVSGSGLLSTPGSCHRWATVAYTRPGAPEVLSVGGPNNPICLSPPRYRHPALFCEAGIETIQTAAPASARSIRLVLADGRTIQSRVVRVPRRDGGPAGIYAQEIRGSTSHAVSLLELNAGGGIVLTLKLPRYRCVKRRGESEGFPTVNNLASGRTPEGEPFTISAFGSLNTDPSNILTPFLSIDTGVNPELNEPAIGRGARKAFPWSLSIGCAPHPYAILYAILQPPGSSVVAQTPQGAIALNVVPIQPRLHAKGPLVYGVFSALPSELTVLGANGSTVYTENLQAKAVEATQFCEGYAEP